MLLKACNHANHWLQSQAQTEDKACKPFTEQEEKNLLYCVQNLIFQIFFSSFCCKMSSNCIK